MGAGVTFIEVATIAKTPLPENCSRCTVYRYTGSRTGTTPARQPNPSLGFARNPSVYRYTSPVPVLNLQSRGSNHGSKHCQQPSTKCRKAQNTKQTLESYNLQRTVVPESCYINHDATQAQIPAFQERISSYGSNSILQILIPSSDSISDITTTDTRFSGDK
uniref:Uncharacterized protein n=1 Tax=Ananas comosus var. bracteatus TaxID=296719 RepID=A0A6V7QCK5_ANACO|nr:unnamed protein product [Ananas comosus var. bracteatus]